MPRPRPRLGVLRPARASRPSRSSRPSGRALLAVALSSVLALTVLATVPGAPAAAATDGSMRIGTYNFRAAAPYDDYRTAITRFKSRVDVAGLQEIGTLERNQLLIEDQHWGYYRPPEVRQNPVIWRRGVFDFLSTPTSEPYYRLSEPRWVERTTGGMEHRRPTWATLVRLRHHDTGRRVSVVNVHLVHGATKRGRAHPDRPKRFDLLTEQIRRLRAIVKAERAAGYDVYAVGDYNVDFRTDRRVRHRKLPFRRFKRIGFRSMWQGHDVSRPGTHGPSYLDQIYNAAAPASRSVATDIVGSDHRPGLATYRLPVAAGYAPRDGSVGFADTSLVGWECDWLEPSRRSAMRFDLQGDLRNGYARVEVTGTATQGVDFELDTSGLYDNDWSRNPVVVRILPDDRMEPDRTFSLRLVDPVHTRVTQAVAEGVIRDDDDADGGGPYAEVCKG